MVILSLSVDKHLFFTNLLNYRKWTKSTSFIVQGSFMKFDLVLETFITWGLSDTARSK